MIVVYVVAGIVGAVVLAYGAVIGFTVFAFWLHRNEVRSRFNGFRQDLPSFREWRDKHIDAQRHGR